MISKRITFCGQPCVLACDGRCDKAWGIWGENERPRRQLSDNPDDYVYIGDGELGTAPPHPGTWEGDQSKPSAVAHANPELLNRWCARACERSALVDAGKPIVLPNMASPQPNIPRRGAPT